MQKYLLDKPTFHVHSLNNIGSHVLTLLQLEHILLSINDPNGQIRSNLSNIASMEPSITSNHLFCCLRHLVITLENLRPTNAQFSTRSRIALAVLIRSSVFHLRDILQSHLTTHLNNSQFTLNSCIIP